MFFKVKLRNYKGVREKNIGLFLPSFVLIRKDLNSVFSKNFGLLMETRNFLDALLSLRCVFSSIKGTLRLRKSHPRAKFPCSFLH